MIAQLDTEYVKTRPLKAVTRLMSYAFFEGRPVTTRGRWINPLVFAHLAVEKRFPRLKKVKKPLFVVGTGRSGTTVLGKILSMHPEVGFLNEPKALWHAIYPKEDVIGNYSVENGRYRLTQKHASDKTSRAAHRLFGAYLRTVGASRVVDKYPELVFRIPFVQALFPDARFILIVRNGWDTIRSIDRWSDRLGQAQGSATYDWWGVNDRKWHLLVNQVALEEPDWRDYRQVLQGLGRHLDRAALEWTLAMREGWRQRQQRPVSVHLVRYEALVANPQKTLAQLLEFCELSSDDKLLSYACNRLVRVPRRLPSNLHPIIEPAFREMMNRLNYG